MYCERHTLSITTDADGAATVYSTTRVTGRIFSVRYVPAGSNELATGADVDLTGEVSGVVIFDKDNIGTTAFTVAPRQPTHDTGGTAALYASGGTAVNDYIVLAGERLKIIVAQGGNTKSGTFYVHVG